MAWTTPATWAVAEVATAAKLNTHLRDNLNALRWAGAYKTADQTLANDATVNDDTHLLIAVGTSETWLFEANVMWTAAAGGFRFTWTGPAGATGSYSALTHGTTGHAAGAALAAETTSTDTDESVQMRGVIVTAGTSGNLRLRWAQNTSDAATLTVKDLSWVRALRL